jgi:hypothetical protein
LTVARGNSYQVWWAADAFGFIWKKEEALELMLKENGSEDLAKPRILNRPFSEDSGTLLRLHHAGVDEVFEEGGAGAHIGASRKRVIGTPNVE